MQGKRHKYYNFEKKLFLEWKILTFFVKLKIEKILEYLTIFLHENFWFSYKYIL